MKADESIGRWRAALTPAAAINLIVGSRSLRGGRDGDLFRSCAGRGVAARARPRMADARDYPPWALVMPRRSRGAERRAHGRLGRANLGLVAWMVTRLSRWRRAARGTLLAALLLCAASLRAQSVQRPVVRARDRRRGQPVARSAAPFGLSFFGRRSAARWLEAWLRGSADACSQASRSCSR
jgi:hypothetical protein